MESNKSPSLQPPLDMLQLANVQGDFGPPLNTERVFVPPSSTEGGSFGVPFPSKGAVVTIQGSIPTGELCYG